MLSDPPQRSQSDPEPPGRPALGALFMRFLRFGLLAWGGPTAQIAMIRRELVEQERWIGPERFNRVLAVYQALPGPEAHELCVYFGMIARGRVGAVLAGLGFMLPGLLLMLACAWAYARWGMSSPWTLAVFAGCQPAVVALVVRGSVVIGRHALSGSDSRRRWPVAVAAAAMQGLGVHFAPALLAGGLYLAAMRAGWKAAAWAVIVLWLGLSLAWAAAYSPLSAREVADQRAHATAVEAPGAGRLFSTGLAGGLLSFGGAYTAIPVVREQAVIGAEAAGRRGWMSEAQFLDGLAIGGVLPSPLIIFGTFVGYMGGGLAGALLVTAGIFLPAFGFTLLGHRLLERIVDEPRVHAFLDGVTCAVVGIMAATAGMMALRLVGDFGSVAIGVAAFIVLSTVKSRWTTPLVVAGAALVGVGRLAIGV